MIRMNFGPALNRTALTVADASICIGDTVMLMATGTGVFSWQGPGVGIAIGNTVSVSPDSNSMYYVSLVDPLSCVSEDSIMITVSDYPVAEVSGEELVCEGSTTTLTASGGTGYLWSTGATTASYSVVVSNAAGCSASDSISVTVLDAPDLVLVGSNAFGGLDNGFATVSATGGTAPYTYLWNDPAGQTDSVAADLAPGTYAVVVTDSRGCSTTDSVEIQRAAVSIGDLIDPAMIQVYPNLAREAFVLSGLEAFGVQEALVVELLDATGRVVLHRETTGAVQLHVDLPTGLAAGVYMLHISSEAGHATKRVQVQR
ncbi:MAG: hypothetical protein OHK0039_43460 [Bacteroidia bacterium]